VTLAISGVYYVLWVIFAVVVIAAAIDAASRPTWAWERTNNNKTLWLLLLILGLLFCGIVGLVAAVIYFASIRPQLVAAQSSAPPGY